MRKRYKGKYKIKNPNKYLGNPTNIIYRSLMERRFMVWCDSNDKCYKWSSSYPGPCTYIKKNDRKKRMYWGKGIKWDSDNSNIYEITLKGPNTLTADANYVWPSADGSSGQSLTTNGSGQFAWSTVGDASLASDQNWTGAQRGTITDIGSVSSGALNIDLSASNNHKVASSGTPVFTFTNFGASGEAFGQSGTITVTHTGSGVPTWNGHCNFAGGLASAPTITADATTVLSYYVFEATNNTTGKVLVEGLSAVSAA